VNSVKNSTIFEEKSPSNMIGFDSKRILSNSKQIPNNSNDFPQKTTFENKPLTCVNTDKDILLGNTAVLTSALKKSRKKKDQYVEKKQKEQYELLQIAHTVLFGEGLKLGLEFPQDFHRTAQCKRYPHGKHCEGSYVQLNSNKETGKSFYTGVVTCGSVWTCAICSSIIQEIRRKEIKLVMEWAAKQGYKAIMITLTFPHRKGQPLKDLLKQQSTALGYLRSGRPFVKIKNNFGYEGMIRALEVTHGVNGWHPHTHEVWFVDKNADVRDLKEQLLKKWLKHCQKVGLVSNNAKDVANFERRAVDIIDGVTTNTYLAKLNSEQGIETKRQNIDSEMAKVNAKKGRKKGRSPFEILAEVKTGKTRKERFKNKRLFLEYAEGMKWKHQLDFSRGLKKRAGLLDMTDEELLEETEKKEILNSELNVLIGKEPWRRVVKEEKILELLKINKTEGVGGVAQWFEERGFDACFDYSEAIPLMIKTSEDYSYN